MWLKRTSGFIFNQGASLKTLSELLNEPWLSWRTYDVSLLSYEPLEQSKILGLLFRRMGLSASSVDELDSMRTIWFGRLLDLTVYQITSGLYKVLTQDEFLTRIMGQEVFPKIEAQDFHAKCKHIDRVAPVKHEVKQTIGVYETEMQKIRKALGSER